MEKSQHSLKRKRNEHEGSEGDDSKITGELHHRLREIRKAAKKAKAFEIQKLVRKLKGLRKNEAASLDIAEHETQLNIIKTIDHEIFANTVTKTKIMKDRVLSQHEHIREAVSREIDDNLMPYIAQGPSAVKVRSRLLSSKILATEITSLCDDLREFLGHESRKTRAVTHDISNIRENTKSSKLRKAKSSKSLSHVDTESGSYRDQEDAITEASWESGTVEDGYSNSSWPSGYVSVEEGPEVLQIKTDEGGDENDENKVGSRELSQNAIKQSSATSTFLPSLSVGFIRGSDESDWSDNEVKITDLGGKKNRRGQRARRAIWEKKYGKNANHKKKQLEARAKRSHGDSDSNRLGDSYRGPPERLAKQSNTFDRSNQITQQSALLRSEGSHRRSDTERDERPLHPSWEAKRKMREKQSTGIVPSQGTKIKFSD